MILLNEIMNKLIYILIFGCCAFAGGVCAQWQESSPEAFSKLILETESRIAANTSYSFATDYFFYNQPDSRETVLKMHGQMICEKGKSYFMNQFDRWNAQDDKLNVTCDTAERVMILKDVDTQSNARKQTADFSAFIKSGCKVKQQETTGLTKFYLEFAPGGTYKAVEIWIKPDKLVERYILYAGQAIEEDTPDGGTRMITPKLEIHYRDYKFGKEVPVKNMRRVSEFVELRDGKYILTPAYQGFELIDLRIQKR